MKHWGPKDPGQSSSFAWSERHMLSENKGGVKGWIEIYKRTLQTLHG